MDRKHPVVVLCLGMPGSASTWIFNICVHLMGLPQRNVKVVYTDDRLADSLEQIEAADEHVDVLVVKSHKADTAIFDFVSSTRSNCLLSIRDPRDCVVSLMERFDFSFEKALASLVKSCHALMRFEPLGASLFRYEQGFFQSSDTILTLHRYLNPEPVIDVQVLKQLYSRESVQKFIDNFALLPPDRIRVEGDDAYDLLKHWHRNHFGDGLVGKWRTRLTREQKEQAGLALAEALVRFGYRDDVDCAATDTRSVSHRG